MEQRRLLVFLVLSMSLLFLWTFLQPPPQRPPAKPPAAVAPEDGPAAEPVAKATSAKPGRKSGSKPGSKPGTAANTEPETNAEVEVPAHPFEVIAIGSDDPKSGYALRVRLSTLGAAVLVAESNDPRYLALPRSGVTNADPLWLVGDHLREIEDEGTISSEALLGWSRAPDKQQLPELTLQTSIGTLDRQLQQRQQPTDLKNVNWKIIDRSRDGSVVNGVTFQFRFDDISVTKVYRLGRLPDEDLARISEGTDPTRLVDLEPAAYQLAFSLTLKNHGKKPRTLVYDLQGPVGVPLENLENARYNSSIKWAKLNEELTVEAADAMAAAGIAEEVAEGNTPEIQKSTWHYVGIDVQYFAALLFPDREQLQEAHQRSNPDGYIAEARPGLVRAGKDSSHSQVSLVLRSHDIELAPDQSVTHKYTLFTGPKRPTLLNPLKAQDILDLTNFLWIGKHVARVMLLVLGVIHSTVPFLGYGFAIIMLTVGVRLCMHPLTRKQAISAKVMKDLKPEIEKLKKKHGDDKQAFGRAQMELFRKNNYNPLSGCLPIVIQLPIFIGLYQSLGSSVDLRRAAFLYIDNLAAPDALFHHGLNIPFLGPDFNLLPLVTVALYLVNNKMFMPPPTTPEAEMQQKMMNVMMIVFGFMFYRLPAGLLMYFIVSTLWGMGERKLLDLRPPPTRPSPSETEGEPRRGLWARFGEFMDDAHQRMEEQKKDIERQKPGRGSNKKRHRR